MNFGVVPMDNIHVPADVPDELIETYLDNMAAATAGTPAGCATPSSLRNASANASSHLGRGR